MTLPSPQGAVFLGVRHANTGAAHGPPRSVCQKSYFLGSGAAANLPPGGRWIAARRDGRGTAKAESLQKACSCVQSPTFPPAFLFRPSAHTGVTIPRIFKHFIAKRCCFLLYWEEIATSAFGLLAMTCVVGTFLTDWQGTPCGVPSVYQRTLFCTGAGAPIPSPGGKVPQCAHWGGRGMRAVMLDFVHRNRLFANFQLSPFLFRLAAS